MDILWQTAEATAALHQAQVVHRDIKPDNIMVTPGGVAVLTDLGLAHILDEQQAQLTQTRQFVGTVRYASPEQILDAKSVDFRSDVYSLGATLWEALTLKPIYGAGDISPLEAMSRVIKNDSPPPSRFNRRVPHDLDAIVMKCLEKDPARRYSTARELADDLRRWLNNEPVSATSPTLTYLASKYLQKHWRYVGAAMTILTAILVCVCVSIGFILWNWQQTRTHNAELANSNHQLDAARNAAQLHRQEAELHRYVSDIRLAGNLLAADDPLQARAVLATHVKAADKDYRGWEWHLLWQQCMRHREPIATHNDVIRGLAVCKEKSLVAWVDWQGHLIAKDLETATEKINHQGLGKLYAVALSPNGRLAAAAGKNGKIDVWDFYHNPGRIAFTLPGHTDTVTELEFDPNSQLLFSGSDDSQIRVWDLEGKELKSTLRGHKGHIHGLKFGANVIASGDQYGRLILHDAKTFGIVKEIQLAESPVLTLAFSPDNKFLSVGGGDSNRPPFLTTLNTSDWSQKTEHLGLETRPYATTYGADSSRLFVGTSDGSVLAWDPQNQTPLYRLLAHDRRVTSMVFLPQRSRLLTASNDGNVLAWNWLPSTASELTPLRTSAVLESTKTKLVTVGGASVTAVGFTNDHRWLAAICRDRIQLFDRKRMDPVMNTTEALLETASVSRDGSLAALATQTTKGSSIAIWHVQARRREAICTLSQKVVAIHITADNQHVLLGTDQGRVLIYRLPSKTEPFEVCNLGQAISAFAVSPDGRFIAVSCAREAAVLDAATLTEKRRITGLDGLQCLEFSPDGNELYLGSMDSAIYIVDLRPEKMTNKPQSLGGHRDHVMALAVSPDGRTLASASADGTIKLWNRATLGLMLELQPPVNSSVLCIGFAGDGHQLAAGLINGQVAVWSTPFEMKDH